MAIADRLGMPLEQALDRLTAAEIVQWEAFYLLARDEHAFESHDERMKRELRRILGHR